MATLRARVVRVAAANRHTVAVSDAGAVYSWGCNLQGQLGYGTSDSASNAVPRLVEAVKVCTLFTPLQGHTPLSTSVAETTKELLRYGDFKHVYPANVRSVLLTVANLHEIAGGTENAFSSMHPVSPLLSLPCCASFAGCLHGRGRLPCTSAGSLWLEPMTHFALGF